MPIDKVKLPDDSVQEIHDSRIPGIDLSPKLGSENLVTSEGVEVALNKYLPLTGGTLTGNLLLTEGSSSIYINGSGSSMIYGTVSKLGTIGNTVFGQGFGNTYFRGQNNPVYRKYNSAGNFQEYQMWHEGNDGAGSGLDADLLDGKHNGDLYANGLRYYGHTSTATRLTAGDTLSFNADVGMHYYLITSRMTDGGRPGQDGYGVQMEWDNQLDSGYSWRTQLWVCNSDIGSSEYGEMKIRHQNNESTWGDWHTFAMLDSNVASATKLATPRTIWGQSFDGTADVTGHLYLTGANASSSVANTSQIVFGTSSNNHVVLTSNTNAIIINPTTSSASGQTVIGCNGVGTQFKAGTFSVAGAATFGSSLKAVSLTTNLQTSQPSGGMLPNRQYALGELSGDTTFAMAAGSPGVTNHYFWTFSTGTTAPTITWPAAITSWYGGSAPTISASKHYEVSVLDGVAICMEV